MKSDTRESPSGLVFPTLSRTAATTSRTPMRCLVLVPNLSNDFKSTFSTVKNSRIFKQQIQLFLTSFTN